MASAVYPLGLKHFALGDVVWKQTGGSSIRATLIDTADYTYAATHEYMNTGTVAAAAKEETVAALTLVDAASGGVCDMADAVFSAATGDPTEAIIVWKDGGGGGTSTNGTADLLLAYIEVSVTLNGGDVTAQWDGGANKVFAI